MRRACTGVTLLLSLSFASGLAGQRIADLALVRSAGEAPRALPTISFDSSSVHRKSYWLEGGVVGGLITGAIGMGLSGMCEQPHCSPGKTLSFVMLAVPGFTIGAFIGDSIKKGSADEEDK